MESVVSDVERDLYSLPMRDGGLGIAVLQKCASVHYDTSKVITATLAAIMMNQGDLLRDKTLVTETKS